MCKEGVRWRVKVAEANTEYERQREERVTLWWYRKAVQARISGNLNLTLGRFSICLIICVLRIGTNVSIAQIRGDNGCFK